MFKTLATAAICSLCMLTGALAADDSGSVQGQASSTSPSTGAGGSQMSGGANSEDQGGSGVKASSQGEGATNKDTQPRDQSGTATR